MPCSSRICLFLTEQYCAASAAGLVNGVTVPAADWLVGVLLPKILLWSNSQGQGGHSAMQLRQTLVPLDKYSCLYQRMKEKHGPALIKVSTLFSLMYPVTCNRPHPYTILHMVGHGHAEIVLLG